MAHNMTTVYTDGNPTSNKVIKYLHKIAEKTHLDKFPEKVKSVPSYLLPKGVVAAVEQTYKNATTLILNNDRFPYLSKNEQMQVLIHEKTHLKEMAGDKLSNLIETKNNAQELLLDKYLHLTESIEARVNYVAKNISENAGYGKDFLDNAYKAETRYFSGLMSVAAKMPEAAKDIYRSITGCGKCNKNGYGC